VVARRTDLVPGITCYQKEDGTWDWHLVSDNHKVLCNSDQGYENLDDCHDMAIAIVGGAYRDGITKVHFKRYRR
jgi:uncharacterized protein YegP (UPF0339 family)